MSSSISSRADDAMTAATRSVLSTPRISSAESNRVSNQKIVDQQKKISDGGDPINADEVSSDIKRLKRLHEEYSDALTQVSKKVEQVSSKAVVSQADFNQERDSTRIYFTQFKELEDEVLRLFAEFKKQKGIVNKVSNLIKGQKDKVTETMAAFVLSFNVADELSRRDETREFTRKKAGKRKVSRIEHKVLTDEKSDLVDEIAKVEKELEKQLAIEKQITAETKKQAGIETKQPVDDQKERIRESIRS